MQLHFEGWFQCRLATNPDPSDEPRGISGYTFALPGEPDLDRIIRLQSPVAPRSHGPVVGVSISRVYLEGVLAPAHPLVGASVSLLDDPKFESRNLLLTDDRAGVGFIHPFHLEIASDGLLIRKLDFLVPERHQQKPHKLTLEQLHRRAPTSLDGMVRDAVRVSSATHISDAVAYRRRRKDLLETDLTSEMDAMRRAALRKRIDELSVTDPQDMRVLSMQVYQARAFRMNGPASIIHRSGTLYDSPDTYRPWPIEFWMGCWDADALCGYMSGIVILPQEPLL